MAEATNRSFSEQIRPYVESYIALHKCLVRDLADVSEQLVSSDTPLMRRIYIRLLCTTIEGETSARKQLALAIHDLGKVRLSTKDVAILHNKRFFYQNVRKKKIDKRLYSIKGSVPFSFSIFAKACGTDYNIDYKIILEIENGEILNLFHKTIDCRNRLTHPQQVN